MKILVVYASAHGSTAEMAAFIGRNLRTYDVDVTVSHADNISDVTPYDVIVMGSAVHSSMWLPSLSQFMFRFEKVLKQKTLFMWLSCVIAVEPGGLETAYEYYLWEEALERLNLSRDHCQILAGKLDWEKIDGNEKWLLATNYEGKEMPGNQRGDFRDWRAIAHWAHTIAREAQAPLSFPEVHQRHDGITVKEETITQAEVEGLSWPDNPGEVSSI